jgi:hypothetical protein
MNYVIDNLNTVSEDLFVFILSFNTGDEIKKMCDELPWFLQRMENIKVWKEDYLFECKVDISEETAAFFLLHEIHWKQTKNYVKELIDDENELYGTETCTETYKDGVLHSFDDKYAAKRTTTYPDYYSMTVISWYENGLLHRDNKQPAYLCGSERRYYYKGGLYEMFKGQSQTIPNMTYGQEMEIVETHAKLRDLGILHLYWPIERTHHEFYHGYDWAYLKDL